MENRKNGNNTNNKTRQSKIRKKNTKNVKLKEKQKIKGVKKVKKISKSKIANKKKQNKNLRKNSNKRKFVGKISFSAFFVISIIFIAVCVYVVRGITVFVNRKETPLVTVEYGSVEIPTVFKGVIIRDEKVYISNAAGTLSFNYDNLDRVKKGAEVCIIQNQAAVDELKTSLEQLNQEILKIQDQRGEISAFSQEAKDKNKHIKDIIDNHSNNYINGNFAAVYTLKENVERNINIRNNMLLTENKGSVSGKIEEKERFENTLNKNIAYMRTDNSGILSYIIDGQEHLLTFETMRNITPEQTRMKIDYDEFEQKKTIDVNEEIFKIVQNEWYIALYIENKVIENWESGDRRNVFIEKGNSFQQLEMLVDEIKRGDETSLLILKSTKNVTDYINMRNVNIKLSNNGYEGLKIPQNAIADKTLIKIPVEYINEDEGYSVIKKVSGVNQVISIIPQRLDEEFMYVFKDMFNLGLGDIIVKKDSNETYTISKVENIKGVFLVDNGYADFKQVFLNSEISDTNGFVILDIEQNKHIAANSRIIYDWKNIKDGQKIR